MGDGRRQVLRKGMVERVGKMDCRVGRKGTMWIEEV